MKTLPATKKDKLNQLMKIQYMPVEHDYSLEKHEKITLESLATKGLSVASIVQVAKNITTKKDSATQLFRLVEPKDLKGVLKFTNGYTLGNYHSNETGLITNRARFEAIPSATLAINPYLLLITVAVTMINKKLDSIKNIQLDIFEFLKLQEEAKIEGNIKTLQEISEEYQYNIDNDKYKTNKHILVQDIKRDSEQSMIFAKKIIVEEMSKTKLIQGDKKVQDKIEKVERQFRNYQLALYQFSYSSFLEVMLLENFDYEYLDAVYNKIINCINEFREIKKNCMEEIHNELEKTIESTSVKVISNVSKGLGKLIEKIPGIKNGNVDETLLETSEKIDKYNEKRIDTKIDLLLKNQEECSLAFANNVKVMKEIFNEEIELIFDIENIYFLQACNQ